MSSRKLDQIRPAKSAAQRKRDERDRRRNGEDIFRLHLPRSAVIDSLIELGELAEWSEDDPQEVAQALRRLVLSRLPNVTRDMFEDSDLLNSDDEINRDSAHAGKGKPNSR